MATCSEVVRLVKTLLRLMSQYYYYDGENPIGPHSATEIAQLIRDSFLSVETLVFPQGAKDWQPASVFPELIKMTDPVTATTQRPVVGDDSGEAGELAQTAVVTVSPAQTEVQEEGDDDEEEKGLSKYQILRLVRSELDRLWECQRESIIATIKNEELDPDFSKTRKQGREIKSNIENLAVDYFRKSNVLRDWIRDLTWESDQFKSGRADVRKRLKGTSCEERYTDAVDWLDRMGLSDVEGCYCFQNEDKSYRYIGKSQSRSIGQRLKDWERASFWLESTHLRIVIPKFKSQTTKLERLLIMLHQPMQNEKPGDKGGNNPADKVLEMIHSEIHDLLVDG
jgi:hypothetical protein